jgi:hypothetical protein
LRPPSAAGKRLWSFVGRTLRGRHQPAPDVLVIADGGDRRALSLAYALCDALRFPRESVIFRPNDPDWGAGTKEKAPNARVYSMTRECRSLVVLYVRIGEPQLGEGQRPGDFELPGWD